MKVPGLASSMKKLFHDEGEFTIRVTSLGASKFLLEDLMEGELSNFIEERREWWSQWTRLEQ